MRSATVNQHVPVESSFETWPFLAEMDPIFCQVDNTI
jgi:hypothetical protein